jgi:hypothetical protein
MVMSRRSRSRKATQSDRRIGILLIGVGIVLIISLSALVWWFREIRVVLDAQTMCPKTGPYAVHILLFDQSDPITGQQGQRVRQKIESIKDSAKPGYRFDVYSFDGDSRNVLAPILTLCSPGRREDANELYQNPESFRRRYDERFTPVLENVVKDLLKKSTRANSPIIESLRAASLSSFGSFDGDKIRLRVTMISDMVQHTSATSHFAADPNFQQLSKTAQWASLRPNLKGAEVDIIYLLRPEAKRKGVAIQNQGHQMFWEQLIRASGGRVVGIEPI